MLRLALNRCLLLSSLFVVATGRAQTPAPASATGSPPSTPEPSAPSASPAEQSKALSPPAVQPTVQAATPPTSWFYRAPFEVKSGEGADQWKLTIYGFIEADYIRDSTRSFNDAIGGGSVARPGTNAAKHERATFVSRNSRIGFKMSGPQVGGVRPSAVLEGDFFGTLPGTPPAISEGTFYTNPDFRIRHAYLRMETDVVDVWAGQTYNLFGWQSYFFPCSVQYLGLPNMIFGRTPQLRVLKTIKSDAINFDIAVAALRPPQRDAAVPDIQAGARLSLNKLKAISTPGNGGTAAFPAAIGVSSSVRRFRVDAYPNATDGQTHSKTGWGVAVDALIPIIPAANSDDRGNALTLNGEFTTGTGHGDLIGGTTGGANFPANPPAAGAMTGTPFVADIDNGWTTYDAGGFLHTVDWTTFAVGLQYYLPPDGRISLAGNFTHGHSGNMGKLFPNSAAQFETSRYIDGTVYFDVTPAIRVGGAYQNVSQKYVDGVTATNHRLMGIALYFF